MPWLLESNQWVCDVCWIEVPAAATDDPETIQHNCHKDRFKHRRVRRGSGQPLPDLPCLYRGELLQEATFELCGSYRGQKVGIHRCLLHGDECTTRKYCDRTPGHRFCNLCENRFTPEQNEGYEWHDEGRVTYQNSPRATVKNRVLLKFGHGLGDVVFFSSVLAHLREHRPDLEIDIDVGHERRGLVAHLVGPHQGPPYEAEYSVRIHECDRAYPDGRISKWGKCLWEEFGVMPCADLCRFNLPATTPHDAAAKQWAGGRKLVLIHHAGTTSKSYKDLPWPVVERAARTIVDHGGVPVLLDRSGRALQGGVTLSRCPWSGVTREPSILFLDDLSNRWNEFSAAFPHAVRVLSRAQCIAALESQAWDIVTLDHDLNDGYKVPPEELPENDGTHVAEWIAANHGRLRIGRLMIHSTNSHASRRMQKILSMYDVPWVPFNAPTSTGKSLPFDAEERKRWCALSPLADNDATWILALARQSVLCIGIDSGPGHIFAGSGTPTIQCWTKHHPVHYGNPSPTVTHLVPRNHEDWIYGDPAICRDWLAKNYTLSVYDDLGQGLTREIVGWMAS